APSAIWFLFPGRESLTLAPPAANGPAGAAACGRQPSSLPEAAASPGSGPGGDGPRALQTGLFSREENAKAMAARLSAAGFSPAIVPRKVNDADYWAVTVPPEADSNRTILRLKEAGFESFPVF
ncbi:MAG: SPOR domain-containing protein, partial [Treponema sp.]|nr:SPOR domain-containing protein [Treponema sp.]